MDGYDPGGTHVANQLHTNGTVSSVFTEANG